MLCKVGEEEERAEAQPSQTASGRTNHLPNLAPTKIKGPGAQGKNKDPGGEGNKKAEEGARGQRSSGGARRRGDDPSPPAPGP